MIQRQRLLRLWLTVGAGLVLIPGCERSARLTGRKLRDVTVRTVTPYGVRLDQEASPEQVAYVLLRAIRDDFLAANEAEREAALDIQFDVAAVDEILAWNSMGLTREEALFMMVHNWTPTVSHYVHDFETDWDQARARLVTHRPRPATEGGGGKSECQVLMEVHDPGGDPNANAVLVVWLVEDQDYWRVLRVGFAPDRRSLKARKITAGRSKEGAPAPEAP